MLTNLLSLTEKIERGELRLVAELGYKAEQIWFYEEILASTLPNYRRLRQAIERNPVLEVTFEAIAPKLASGGHVYVDYREYAIGYVAGM